MKGLEYVLLAGLWVEPRSGYDLAHWFQRAAHYYWAAHHSSIYPTLAGLEQAGLVTHQLVPSEQGPKRKVYRLTETGKDTLQMWISQPPQPPEVRDEQPVKVLAIDLLSPEEGIRHLEAAKSRAQEQRDMYSALLLQLSAEEDDRPQRQWLGPRLNLMRGIQIQEGYVRWCDEAIALLQASTPRLEAREK
ncbi:PadR family transcriptional regulator [Deinococcus oregonensis]|uniref:PadR family transcriptional regulator n=1 Tax=Deinococcus oregonensis TaxID=1805970 RepID=A0ABV6B6Y6_9DEIO